MYNANMGGGHSNNSGRTHLHTSRWDSQRMGRKVCQSMESEKAQNKGGAKFTDAHMMQNLKSNRGESYKSQLENYARAKQ